MVGQKAIGFKGQDLKQIGQDLLPSSSYSLRSQTKPNHLLSCPLIANFLIFTSKGLPSFCLIGTKG